MTPLAVTSVQLENQETTRVVTLYPSGNVTSDNEISSSKNESTSVTNGQSRKSANTMMSESTTSGPGTSSTVTSSGSVNEVVIQRYEENVNNGLHVIHPAVAISSGTYSLEIDYEIMFDGKAIYSASFGESGEER